MAATAVMAARATTAAVAGVAGAGVHGRELAALHGAGDRQAAGDDRSAPLLTQQQAPMSRRTPSLGTPSLGTPSLGTPSLGTPPLGTPSLGLPSQRGGGCAFY